MRCRQFSHGKDRILSRGNGCMSCLIPPTHADHHSHTLADSRRQPSHPEPTMPFDGYPTKPDNDAAPNDELAPRRPSLPLPHVYNDLPLPSHSTSSRRPQSAGQDAEPKPPRAPTTRKLSYMYSLLNVGDTPDARHQSQQSQIAVYLLRLSFYYFIGITFPISPCPCHQSFINVTSNPSNLFSCIPTQSIASSKPTPSTIGKRYKEQLMGGLSVLVSGGFRRCRSETNLGAEGYAASVSKQLPR